MISSKEKTKGESLPGGVRFSRWSGKAPLRRWHLSQDLQDGKEPRWWAGWGRDEEYRREQETQRARGGSFAPRCSGQLDTERAGELRRRLVGERRSMVYRDRANTDPGTVVFKTFSIISILQGACSVFLGWDRWGWVMAKAGVCVIV